ncbi:hypothetical protein L7F22_040194 [Adiantum nelumboides]|nr:hypothetical protein [Adiantum nelumboides]
MLRKYADGEPVSPKYMFPEASFYGKHGGKYLPYSNVDSFLKVCQKLGLAGIDLFSPPDVVEKKDIRRVCLCIRALSKKARARHLEVPEFDYVTHSSVSMPTEIVGGLRDSLRQASANNSPRDRETPDKVGLGPLRMRRPASGLSLAETDTEEGAKEPARSLNFDKTYSGDQQQSVIDPNTPPLLEENSGFSSGSRSLGLSDDERAPPERSSFDDANEDSTTGNNLDTSAPTEGPGNGSASLDGAHAFSDESSKALQKAVDTSSEMPSADRLGDAAGNHKNAAKKGAWILPSLAAALALLGASLFVKPRDSSIYEVKRGDTLSEISRRVGKSNWQELVLLNPDITNPDLIHPNDRLRLHS